MTTHISLSRTQVRVGLGVVALAIGGYLGAWMFLDSNFDGNRSAFRTEAEATRAMIVEQADWIRSELLTVVTACGGD